MSNSPVTPKRSWLVVMVKVFLIGLVIISITGFLGYLLQNHHSTMSGFTQIWQQYAIGFFLWRMGLIAVIVYVWPYYIGKVLKRAIADRNKRCVKNIKAYAHSRVEPEEKYSDSIEHLEGNKGMAKELESREWLKSRYLILGVLLLLEFAVNFNEIVIFLGKI